MATEVTILVLISDSEAIIHLTASILITNMLVMD